MTKKIEDASIYRRLIAAAWGDAWKHKQLWLFGFFAAFAGFGGIYEVLLRAHDRMFEALPLFQWTGSPFYLLPGAATFRALIALSPNPVLTVSLFLVMATVISAVFVWVVTVSVGALIGSADRLRRGTETDFGEGIRIGAAKFWRLLGINLLAKAAITLAVIFIGVDLFTLLRDGSIVSAIFFILAFIIFLAIAVAVSIIAVYASNQAVLNDTPFRQAIAAGWNLFVGRWLVSLETAALILAVDLAAALAAVLGLMILSVPVIFLFLLAGVTQSTGLVITLATLSAITLFGAVIAYGSFMTTFQVIAWTRLWAELTAKKPRSKTERLFDRLLAVAKVRR